MDFVKYYSSMPNAQLERLIKKDLLSCEHKSAIEEVLRQRHREAEEIAAENGRLEAEIAKTRKSKPARMFANRSKLTSRIGRIFQGGKVSPR